jgi:hypothetical protein
LSSFNKKASILSPIEALLLVSSPSLVMPEPREIAPSLFSRHIDPLFQTGGLILPTG